MALQCALPRACRLLPRPAGLAAVASHWRSPTAPPAPALRPIGLGFGSSAAAAAASASASSSSGAAAGAPRVPVRLSPRMTARVMRNILEGIDLVVCDMAGTTVKEGGIVYKTLQLSMKEFGIEVSDAQMEPWHGAKKESVIEHFAREKGIPEEDLEIQISRIGDAFIKSIDQAYFSAGSGVDLIDVDLFSYFKSLRQAGVKIALDTGYPPNIQEGLVKKLKFDEVVDGWISSYDVKDGRPYPYMIHQLMERLHIESVKRVAKVGDSVRDIEEGRNAGCGLVVGVLSGADDAQALMAAGADVVADCITDLPVPRGPARTAKLRLPDLS